MLRKKAAFTLVEGCIVIAVVAILAVVVWIALVRLRQEVVRDYDGMQIRSIHQAMVTWAGQSQDRYPRPSSVDWGDTIPGIQSNTDETKHNRYRKDLPRWVMSMLIYNGSFGPQSLIGMTEVNSVFKADERFEYSKPTAVEYSKRDQAILDPAFACYPDEPGGDVPIARGDGKAPQASCSYAFMTYVGGRENQWASTFDASQGVVANRGPWYALGADGKWTLDAADKRGSRNTPATKSNTLKLYGRGNRWQGNVARNDNSVTFEISPDPESIAIKFSGGFTSGIPKYDNLFANEDEDSDGSRYTRSDDEITPATVGRKNNYLRCWGGGPDGANLGSDPASGQTNAIRSFWYD